MANYFSKALDYFYGNKGQIISLKENRAQAKQRKQHEAHNAQDNDVFITTPAYFSELKRDFFKLNAVLANKKTIQMEPRIGEEYSDVVMKEMDFGKRDLTIKGFHIFVDHVTANNINFENYNYTVPDKTDIAFSRITHSRFNHVSANNTDRLTIKYCTVTGPIGENDFSPLPKKLYIENCNAVKIDESVASLVEYSKTAPSLLGAKEVEINHGVVRPYAYTG
jgi:hypothetical protein